MSFCNWVNASPVTLAYHDEEWGMPVREDRRQHPPHVQKITASVGVEVQQKVERLKLPKGRTVRLVLVYAGEIDPSIEENGYFDSLIPASALL